MILPWPTKKKKARDLHGPRVRMWLMMRDPLVACNPATLVVINITKDKSSNGYQDSPN